MFVVNAERSNGADPELCSMFVVSGLASAVLLLWFIGFDGGGLPVVVIVVEGDADIDVAAHSNCC